MDNDEYYVLQNDGYFKRYNSNNKDMLKEYSKAYKDNDKERIKETSREYKN